MIAIDMIHFAQKFLRILLVVLVLAGIGLLVRVYFENRAAEREYRPYLEALERVYDLRKQNVVERYDRKIREAPTELQAMAHQQEKSSVLSEIDDRYFSDKRSIYRREYDVLEENWPEEIRMIEEGESPDDR